MKKDSPWNYIAGFVAGAATFATGGGFWLAAGVTWATKELAERMSDKARTYEMNRTTRQVKRELEMPDNVSIIKRVHDDRRNEKTRFEYVETPVTPVQNLPYARAAAREYRLAAMLLC